MVLNTGINIKFLDGTKLVNYLNKYNQINEQ